MVSIFHMSTSHACSSVSRLEKVTCPEVADVIGSKFGELCVVLEREPPNQDEVLGFGSFCHMSTRLAGNQVNLQRIY
jgi:hypothetical protein